MNKKYVWGIGIFLALLIITYFSGPIPNAPVYPHTLPRVSGNLKALEDSIVKSESQAPVRPGNEAHIVWQDSTPTKTKYCFLYLHGFAGSYRDGYPLNKLVADRYHGNLYMARWAGHGLQPEYAMKTFSPEEAWLSARQALAVALQLGEKVIILSTSTGGTLAIKLAEAFPGKVEALINISPNIRDEQAGASLLNTPWGSEIAHLVFMGDKKKVKHEQDSAKLYWDTIYPVQALLDLQNLLETTMIPETYKKVTCPVLTLYYYDDLLHKDRRVDIERYPEVHEQLGTPDSLQKLVSLSTPGTHFIGSSIKSEDYNSALDVIYEFCEDVLGLEPLP